MTFAVEVVARARALGPLCAGVDPAPELLEAWGLGDDPAGLAVFCDRCLEAFAGVVPVVKAQVAFFERHGAAGLAVLEDFLAKARSAELLVIADAKRADIANTMEAYADAWLDPKSPLAADAVTAVPYLGLGSLEPMFERARHHGRGVFVVVRSSNPEGRAIQEARLDGEGRRLEDALLQSLGERNAKWAHGTGPGPLGAVVGATLEPSAFPIASLRAVVLAPGVGAQGAGPRELRRLFAGCPAGTVVPNVSRSVLAAGPAPGGLRAAAEAVRDEVAMALS